MEDRLRGRFAMVRPEARGEAPFFGRKSGGWGGFPGLGAQASASGRNSVGKAGACRPMQGYVYEVSSRIMRFNMMRICALQD